MTRTALLFLSAALMLPVSIAAQIRADAFSPMVARSIGPAGMSGRTASVDVVQADPTTIFVGAATGGLWRSRDGGVSWRPVFDEQPALSIGAVRVNQQNPDIVWVGTGEGNPRNSMGVGYGVFKSLDGGDTWTHLGLEGSERIHRIALDPRDSDVAYVGAMGPAWSDGEERGVFRTRDGGETWERVLYVDARTGVADLVMDPENPNKLFAAMWEFRRSPWFFESGGPGSGLYVTHDGGDSWDRLGPEDGLPPGPLGRIGLAIARSDPDIVYALVEAEHSALIRSADGGRTWETISDEPGVVSRPFYYADIRVDPLNENRLYSLKSQIEVSEDQGHTFRTVVPSRIIHGDVQELWIHDDDPRFMIIGNDGGIGITRDRGEHWRFVENLPFAQFYHVSVDDAVPFNVYGGLQDNGSWYGPSTVWEDPARGIMNAHWRRVGSGDGFTVLNDFSDERFGFSTSQEGNLRRFDKVTGERRDIRPVLPDGPPLRFNWNAALVLDPRDRTVLYLGSQFLHRTRDQGVTWETISPDLTTDDPDKQRQDQSGGLTLDATGAENHTTIITVAPSPVQSGLIWVGTDDGNVQMTRDDGGTWTNVTAGLAAPEATWVPHVEASHQDPGTAYVVQDDHRRGNWTTYVQRTEDFGRTWTSLATDDVFGFAHVIREDPVEPRLLYLGTEFGLYVSLDRGASWMRWTHGIPAVPVRDVVVHPRDHDLVVATHGRGMFIVDDIRPLQALARDPSLARTPVTLFRPPPAYAATVGESIGYRSVGHAMFFGDLRPEGALLSYWVGEGRDGARVEVRDGSGALTGSLSGSSDTGLNRVVWDLEAAGDSAEAAGTEGLPVLPGEYRVTVRVGADSAQGMLTVLADPRENVSMDDRAARLAARTRVGGWAHVAEQARQQLQDAMDALGPLLDDLEDSSSPLEADGRTLLAGLEREMEELFEGPRCQGICGGTTVVSWVDRADQALGTTWERPGDNDRILMGRAQEAAQEIVDRVNALFAGEVSAYRQALVDGGAVGLTIPPPLGIQR